MAKECECSVPGSSVARHAGAQDFVQPRAREKQRGWVAWLVAGAGTTTRRREGMGVYSTNICRKKKEPERNIPVEIMGRKRSGWGGMMKGRGATTASQLKKHEE